jgi:hypothetical protein
MNQSEREPYQMNHLQAQIAALPTQTVGGATYLSYEAVTDAVAAFLFPPGTPTPHSTEAIDAAQYQQILETADTLCRALGYQEVVKLAPPDVPWAAMGLYWTTAAPPIPSTEPVLIHVGPSRAEMMAEGLLLDGRLGQLGLDEISRQHFKIPVTASDGVVALLHRSVAAKWPNDYRGLWHDILGMCVTGGRDISPTERQFTVIIQGLAEQRYWVFQAQVQQVNGGEPFLFICLANEAGQKESRLFPLGHVVMTPGAAALGVDFTPYLARHAQGEWGELDYFDRRQNDTAVRQGYRILSAYNVPLPDGESERIWVITESDRSATTVLLPAEY